MQETRMSRTATVERNTVETRFSEIIFGNSASTTTTGCEC